MSRLSGFQLDRAKLDSHMLELAFRFCCDLWRPAKVTGFELNDGNGQTVNAVVDGEERSAAGFIDPLYSPGLDFCSYTSYYVADLLARGLKAEDVTERLNHYKQHCPVTNRSWFKSLYKDKYY